MAPLGLALRALLVAAVDDSAIVMVLNMNSLTTKYLGDTRY